MNLFRHAILPATLAFALAASSAVIAQTPPAPGSPTSAQRHGAFNRALRSLDLTPDQLQQIAQLTKAYHQAHPKGSAHDPAAEKQLHAAIMNVLTPEQQAKFSAQRAAMRAGPQEIHPRMAEPMSGISLTDAQKAQIQALTQQYRAQILNVLTPEQKAQYQKNSAGMPDAGTQMRKGGGFRAPGASMMSGITLTAEQKMKIESLMAAFRQAHRGSPPDAAARQAFHEQILQVLTPEQQAQFKANAQRMQRGGPFSPDPTPTPEG